jgi:hypothetical protein
MGILKRTAKRAYKDLWVSAKTEIFRNYTPLVIAIVFLALVVRAYMGGLMPTIQQLFTSLGSASDVVFSAAIVITSVVIFFFLRAFFIEIKLAIGQSLSLLIRNSLISELNGIGTHLDELATKQSVIATSMLAIQRLARLNKEIEVRKDVCVKSEQMDLDDAPGTRTMWTTLPSAIRWLSEFPGFEQIRDANLDVAGIRPADRTDANKRRKFVIECASVLEYLQQVENQLIHASRLKDPAEQ